MDMNNVVAISGILIGISGVTLFLFPKLKEKKVNVSKAINAIQQGTDTADLVLSAVNKMIPGNPVINVLEIINKWGRIAAGYAEQLYHAGDIKKNEREQVAETVALNVLKELNIPVDDNKKTLIDAAIKNAVNDLGHASLSEEEKNAQIEKIKQDLALVQTENAELKQTILKMQSKLISGRTTSIK